MGSESKIAAASEVAVPPAGEKWQKYLLDDVRLSCHEKNASTSNEF